MPVTIVFMDGARTPPALQAAQVLKWLALENPHFTDTAARRREIDEFLTTTSGRYGFLEAGDFLLDLATYQRGKERYAELATIRQQQRVSGVSRPVERTSLETVHIGVSFRTDGFRPATGVGAHVDHDMKAIAALNELQDTRGQRLFPFRVVPVALPRGSSGGATPVRTATASELDGIDLLYIPGAPVANDTQIDDPEEGGGQGRLKVHEAPKNKDERKDNETAARVLLEHRSRAAYELKLLGMAKTRGIPVLAVCAGSWRLLESYGGSVRTLEVTQRVKHKDPDNAKVWQLQHALRLLGGHTLVKLMLNKGIPLSLAGTCGIPAVNSTHWAVASTSGSKLASGASDEPGRLLAISAMDPDTDTVEAFESLYGVPVMGIQWHPECYLPGMLGDMTGRAAICSQSLFEFMVLAAGTSARRRSLLPTLNREGSAFADLCECARLLAKDKPVGAGHSYQSAVAALPRADWSGRLHDVDEAISQIGESIEKQASGNQIASWLLFGQAQKTLRRYGVTV